MQVSNHPRRRALSSPTALAAYGLMLAALTAGGAWLNVELGSDGEALVPIAAIVPSVAGIGITGVIVGRYSARPPGGPLRPSPPPPRAITRAAVTSVVPASAHAPIRYLPGPMSLGHSDGEVRS